MKLAPVREENQEEENCERLKDFLKIMMIQSNDFDHRFLLLSKRVVPETFNW